MEIDGQNVKKKELELQNAIYIYAIVPRGKSYKLALQFSSKIPTNSLSIPSHLTHLNHKHSTFLATPSFYLLIFKPFNILTESIDFSLISQSFPVLSIAPFVSIVLVDDDRFTWPLTAPTSYAHPLLFPLHQGFDFI